MEAKCSFIQIQNITNSGGEKWFIKAVLPELSFYLLIWLFDFYFLSAYLLADLSVFAKSLPKDKRGEKILFKPLVSQKQGKGEKAERYICKVPAQVARSVHMLFTFQDKVQSSRKRPRAWLFLWRTQRRVCWPPETRWTGLRFFDLCSFVVAFEWQWLTR